ncbi:MAG: endopeptidase [Aquabacterium sp.]|nr:hypothetical protein [Dechloromonas sp.]MCH2240985.1 endopeptidase [Aquabacterium sp.]
MSHYDPTDLQAQDAARQAKTTEQRNAAQTEADDVKWLMSSKRGRRIVWRQLEQAAVFRLTFNTNAMQMAFAEGNRNQGVRLLALVHQVAPQLYPVMVEENRA